MKVQGLFPRRWMFIIGVVFFSFASCFNHENQNNSKFQEVEFHAFEIKYAKGFSCIQSDSILYVLIHNPESGEVIDTLDILGSSSTGQKIFRRLVAQSTTHFAYLDKVNYLDQLVGLCGLQYLDENQKAMARHIGEICNGQGVDVEKIVAIQPDLVFLYPFGDKDKLQLTKLGIQTVYLTEYLECSPLARAEWLKLFALISGQDPNKCGFEIIEQHYLDLRTKNSLIHPDSLKNNRVGFNLPFGDSWDMPSEQSLTAQLIRDAGFHYEMDGRRSSGNYVFKLEEAYQLLSHCAYWVIIAARPENFTLQDLIAENRVYGQFPSVRNKQVIFCNTQTTPYFSKGPIEPHLMLKDLRNCIAGRDAGNRYFKILK